MGIVERRELIETFLRRCVTYADASIERKKKRGDDEEIIAKWQAYRDFTEPVSYTHLTLPTTPYV